MGGLVGTGRRDLEADTSYICVKFSSNTFKKGKYNNYLTKFHMLGAFRNENPKT